MWLQGVCVTLSIGGGRIGILFSERVSFYSRGGGKGGNNLPKK